MLNLATERLLLRNLSSSDVRGVHAYAADAERWGTCWLAHWGQGYASEAAAAVLDFARDELGLERVEATCRPANVASQRVL